MKKLIFLLCVLSSTLEAQYIHAPSFGRFSSIQTNGIGVGLTSITGSATNMTAGIRINQAGNDDDVLSFVSSDIDHGITDYRETSLYGAFLKGTPAEGGLQMVGISEGTSNALIFTGVVGSTPASNNYVFKFLGAKKNAKVTKSVDATDNLLGVTNNGTAVLIIKGDGKTCFGTDSTPDAKLEVEGGGVLANDSLRVGAGGIWQRNWYYNAADSSVAMVFYNTTLARIDTVFMKQP